MTWTSFLCLVMKSLAAIDRELQNFRLQSGFTVSYDKTTIYRIGSLRHSSAQMYSMEQYKWSNDDINVLGVTIAHNDIVLQKLWGDSIQGENNPKQLAK